MTSLTLMATLKTSSLKILRLNFQHVKPIDNILKHLPRCDPARIHFMPERTMARLFMSSHSNTHLFKAINIWHMASQLNAFKPLIPLSLMDLTVSLRCHMFCLHAASAHLKSTRTSTGHASTVNPAAQPSSRQLHGHQLRSTYVNS